MTEKKKQKEKNDNGRKGKQKGEGEERRNTKEVEEDEGEEYEKSEERTVREMRSARCLVPAALRPTLPIRRDTPQVQNQNMRQRLQFASPLASPTPLPVRVNTVAKSLTTQGISSLSTGQVA